MFALDFEFDGQYLADYGYIICNFDGSSGANTVSAGSSVTFNKVSRHSGTKYSLTSTSYEECVQATFCICKNPKLYKANEMCISNDEFRELMRWLNRREFLPFRLVSNEDMDSCYYNASFNVSKVNIDEVLCGLELTMETDRPFGYGQERILKMSFGGTKNTYLLSDYSDEIGEIAPTIKIVCNESGDLILHNDFNDCNMKIKNCTAGEEITIHGDTQIITTSLNSHRIYNDFNFEFFKIGNSIATRSNKISATLSCDVEIRYNPIIKDSI